MKLLPCIFLTTLIISIVYGTEWEPEPENHDILLKALQSIQSSKGHSTHYDPAHKTSLYYRSIKHIGRVRTVDGIRHLFIVYRIRSGNLETQSETPPPRGSWQLAVFDSKIRLLTIKNTEEHTRVEGTLLRVEENLVYDLSNREELERAGLR